MGTASAPGTIGEIPRADYRCSGSDGFLFGPGFDSPHLHKAVYADGFFFYIIRE
jgi:hypothetical protein